MGEEERQECGVFIGHRRTITGQWWRKRSNSCQMYRTRNHWPHTWCFILGRETYDWYTPGNIHTFLPELLLHGVICFFFGQHSNSPLVLSHWGCGIYIIKYLITKTLNGFVIYDKTIPYICHFLTQEKFLENKIYTEKRQFFALNL